MAAPVGKAGLYGKMELRDYDKRIFWQVPHAGERGLFISMECLICGQKQFRKVHKGTRDNSNINVLKCISCGMVQLDSVQENQEEKYMQGEMLQNSYNVKNDRQETMDWDLWVSETAADDTRRYEMLKELCRGKRVLDFGCGNGGFLRRIRKDASSVTGIELMKESRDRLEHEGIEMFPKADFLGGGGYDVICMFDVIEHLNKPDDILCQIYRLLSESGYFICETPNSQDALLSKYHCSAFEDFTYWSSHVYLFDSDNLQRLMSRNGFCTEKNEQIQRYSLANHLYWLSHGKPGGHAKWTEFNKCGAAYEQQLIDMGIADTLFWIGQKNPGNARLYEAENGQDD